tara:strand:- start:391 stop:2133 length:1743 start_codon:yes stop_codon:yes gene_type:complete
LRLIKTPIDARSDTLFKEDILLGNWCLEEISDLEKDNNIEPYHWDDRQKYFKDYSYINNLYEEFLNDYVDILNDIHKLRMSKRYWRIILGPWLRFFIEISFDRYEIIKTASKKYPKIDVNIYDYNAENMAPKSFEDFSYFTKQDDWNEVIFSECIKYLNLKYSALKNIKLLPRFNKPKSRNIFYPFLKNIILFYEKFVPRFLNKKVIIASYMNLFDLAKFQISLGQMPYLRGPEIKYSNNKIDLKLRKSIKLEKNSSGFRGFISSLIPFHIPKVYLEGFDDFKSKVIKAYPSNPEIIFTSNAYQADDAFKIWAAEKVSEGRKLVIGQHGGNFGNSLFNQTEDHQLNIADYFISWGWKNSKNPFIKPLPSLKLSNQDIICKNNGKIVHVLTSFPKYFYCHYSVPVADQFLSYVDNQISFLKNLDLKVLDNLIIKPDPSFFNQSWDAKQLISKAGFSNNFDTRGRNFYTLLSCSNLCVCTNNTTTFLETLALNYPTVIFWDKNLFEIREEAISYMKLLEDAGVLYYCPLQASKKINSISNNVEDWWGNSALQDSVEKFTNRYARNSKDWKKEWKIFFNKIAK